MQKDGFKPEMFHVAAGVAEHGTLVLDATGRIYRCGEAGERMLGASQDELVGRRISDFISGLHIGGSSPSYAARYLVYLCGDGEWRKFEAVDAGGRRFPIELNLSRTMTEGKEIFLLNVRRPGKADDA